MIVRVWVDFPGWQSIINNIIQVKDTKDMDNFGPLAACMHSVVGFSQTVAEHKRGHQFEFYLGVCLDNRQLAEFKTARARSVKTIMLPGFNYVHLDKYGALMDCFDPDHSHSRSRNKE